MCEGKSSNFQVQRPDVHELRQTKVSMCCCVFVHDRRRQRLTEQAGFAGVVSSAPVSRRFPVACRVALTVA